MRPQRAAQPLGAEPGAAPLIRKRPTPAADAVLPSIELCPADGPGADDDNAAITSGMGADAGRLRIGNIYRHPIRMLLPPRRLEITGLACARQRQTCYDPAEIAGGQA